MSTLKQTVLVYIAVLPLWLLLAALATAYIVYVGVTVARWMGVPI